MADAKWHGIEHVRARPRMYIGDVYERGLHHLVNEVVDNSVDEAVAGRCAEIDVTLRRDGSVSIGDDGPGISVGVHPKVGLPTLEVCLTRLGAGGKFDKDSYKVSGGLHGVGLSVVNALSEWLEVEVTWEGEDYWMRFERGVTVRELEPVRNSTRRGTRITFKPDAEIFTRCTSFEPAIVARRLRELAFLTAGLRLRLVDERSAQEEEFHFPRGLAAMVDELSAGQATLLRAPIHDVCRAESEESGGVVELELALQYSDARLETVVGFANHVATVEGGAHLTGFRAALDATLTGWLEDGEEQLENDERPSGDCCREGLVAAVSVKVPDPQFGGRTRTELGDAHVGSVVQTLVGQSLEAWRREHPQDATRLVAKTRAAARRRGG